MIRTSYALNKILTAVARQHQIKQRLSEEELAGYELSVDERAALTTGDIKRLYDLGANPYLIRRGFPPQLRHLSGRALRTA